MLASTRRCCCGRMQASAPANAAVAKGCRHPCVDSDLAACRHGAGTRRAVSGYAPADTGGAGTAGSHSCILAAHRVQCAAHNGGLPAGSSRGPASWRSGRTLALGTGVHGPCHAADPRHARRQLCHSGAALGAQCEPFGHCQLYPCAARRLCGRAGRHCRHRPEAAGNGEGLPPAAHRAAAVHLAARHLPVLLRELHRRHGHVLEERRLRRGHRSADHSVGDALYRAKITLSTPDVFAWTLVIVLLSAALSAAAAALLRTAKTRLCGEVRV